MAALMNTTGEAAAEDAFVQAATLVQFEKAPVVDGKLEPGEWDRALRIVGFQGLQPMDSLEPRGGFTCVGFTDRRLYLCVVSDMPPDGKLHARQTNRDSNVVFDESIEIWIDPNRERRGAKEGDQSFYQFIGNAIGTIFDIRFDPNKGAPDAGWNGDWEFGNSVDREKLTWTAELSIPWKDLGWPEHRPVAGRRIGLLVARNFKSPWVQATWFRHQGVFTNWSEFPVLTLTKDAPVAQVQSLGDDPFTGEIRPRVRLVNPGPARRAKVEVKLTSSNMPGRRDQAMLELPARGEAEYEYTKGTAFQAEARHVMLLNISDAATGQPYLAYRLNWGKVNREKAWFYHVGPDPAAAVRISYYPTYCFVRLKIDTAELGKEAEKLHSGTAIVTDEAGTELINEKVTWEGTRAVREFKLPDLPDGTYTLTFVLHGYNEPFVRTFRRIRFPFEGNRLGITKKVYPPFEPVRVAGRNVDVVLRSYRAGDLGLWDSVRSLGKEMLAAPISLKADGRVVRGSVRLVESDDQKAVYEGSAATPAVSLKTRCTTEYDGCMKVELELLPGTEKRELKELRLDIPVKDDLAPLWHVCTSGLRANPTGSTPKGEGDVWDSTQFPDGNWYGNFKCYAWVGGEKRGICWFADNDRGWVLDVDEKKPENSAPCLVLNRTGDVLTLRVNFIQKPFTITQPRKIVFGLMASPAKPLPSYWRRMLYNHARPGYLNVQHMGSEYWGSPTHCAAKYPINGDLSVLDKMQELRLTGDTSTVEEFVRCWVERNLPADLPMDEKVPGTEKTKKQLIDLVRWASLHRMANRPAFQCVYWEEFHSTYGGHPEMQIFGDEWTGDHTSGTGLLAPSYQDFACWYGAHFLRRSLGLYLDNAYPKRAYDPLTTPAYRLPNGKMQPSAGMWAHREYLKRLWVLHQQIRMEEAKPIMLVHMTNTHIVPFLSFNEANLDLEWFYGPEPQQSKYPHDLLRAESIGLQSGCVPFALAFVQHTKTPEEKRIAERTRFGVMMVHEIKAYMPGHDGKLLRRVLDFGYGLDDCVVHNYWDNDYPVKASSDDAKSLLLVRAGKAMLVICTWNRNPETVTFTFNTQALGMTPARAADAETGQALEYENNILTVPLEAYGVRIVMLE